MDLNRNVAWGAISGLLLALALACGGAGQDVTLAKEASAPKIDTFTRTSPVAGATVHLGDVPKFLAKFSGGAATMKDNGVALPVSITSGAEFTAPAITSLGTHTYSLTVTGTAGTTAPAQTTVGTVAITVVSSVSAIDPADGYQTVMKTKTYTATVTGLADTSIVWSSGGAGSWSDNKWTAVNWVGNYDIKATAKDGTFSTTAVHVINMPTASLVVSNSQPKYGATVMVTPVFGGGTAVLGYTQGGKEISDSIGTGTQIESPPITVPTTFWTRVTNLAGDFVDASGTSTPQVVKVSAITPASVYLLVGEATTLGATVTGAQDTTLAWTATGPGSSITPAGTWAGSAWTAPLAVGDYTVTATANADKKTAQTAIIHVIDTPAIQDFKASMNPVPYGDHAALTATFTNGAGTVDQGVGAVTSGVPFDTGALTTSKTYTLTVKSPSGKTVTKTLDLGVLTATISPVTPVAPFATPNSAIRFQAKVSDVVDTSVVWTATGGRMSADGIWRAPTAPGTYTIKAASKVVAATSSSTTVTVIPDPIATSLTAANGTVLYGATAQLTPVFSGGVGSIDNGLGQVTSGTPVSTGAILGQTTYALTVQDNETTHQTNLMANGDAEGGPLGGTTFGADSGVVQDSNHAHGGSWTRAFPVLAGGAPANYRPLQKAVTVTSGQTFQFDAWVRSSSDISLSTPSLRLVWADASGNPISGALVKTDFNPESARWQKITVTGTVPSGVSGLIPALGFGTDPAVSDVGQTIYMDDLSIKMLARVTVTIKTAEVVISSISPSGATMTAGKYLTFSASVSGALDSALTWAATGPGLASVPAGVWSGTTWIAPTTTGVYTITARSAASTSKSTTVTVVDAPTIQGLAALANPIYRGQSTTITPVFAGGVGSVDTGPGTGRTVTSGVPFDTGVLGADTKFTLTVTNAAGDKAQASVTISVKSGVMSPLVPSTKAQSLTRGFQVLGGAITGTTDTAVTWSVNGADGGNATYGTISATGAYAAPVTMPGGGSTATVTIRARCSADANLYQEMTVTLWRLPSITSFTVE